MTHNTARNIVSRVTQVCYLYLGYLAVGIPKNIFAIDTSLRKQVRQRALAQACAVRNSNSIGHREGFKKTRSLIASAAAASQPALRLIPVDILVVRPRERQHVSPQRALAAAGVRRCNVAALRDM